VTDGLLFPLYYLPPDVPRPGHVVHQGVISVLRHVGPEDAAEHERGGVILGGPWDDRAAGLWRRTQAGWWVAMGGAAPEHLARLAPMDGPIVNGHLAGHRWMVPRLMRWRDGHGLVSAVPNEFRDYAWQAPAALEPLMLRLRTLFYWQRGGEIPEVPDGETVDIAVDLLALNYHVSIHELTIAGWLSDRFVLDILRAAVGLDDA
jgi:hypothetical protein